MYAVYCKQERSNSWPAQWQTQVAQLPTSSLSTTQQQFTEKEKRQRGRTVHEDVDKMVAVRLQFVEVKVQIAVGEDGQGAVGLVAFHPGDEPTPKVVLEHLEERGFRRVQVIICEYASVIVEHKIAVQGAEVAEE